MASGFQNSQDQLTSTYYRVAIDTSGYSTTAADNNSGGIEAWDYNYFTTLNTSLNNSKRRARGNLRWNAILQELQRFSNCEILDVTVLKSGPAAETAADHTAVSVTFTVGFSQEEYVFNGLKSLVGAATLSDGATSLSTSDWEALSASNKAAQLVLCVKEAVTRGITIGGSAGYTRRYRTYDPVLVEQRDSDVTVTQPDTPANAWADLTVGIIDTMTQETF
jgi:hypothetical protein